MYEQEKIERYQPDPSFGLTDEQVQQRRKQGLVNIQPKQITKSTGQIIRDNVCTLFNAIMAGIAACLFLVGSYANTLFVFVMLSNITIGIIQEIRAKKTIERLSVLSTPKATVIRNGEKQTVELEEVVLDDIISLSLGNQICLDSIVTDGSVEVNEALLTGEADPLVKQAGDLLLSGSFVVSGSCHARVEHIGMDNYATRLTQEAKKHKKANSILMQSLKKIIKFTSIFVLPLGGLMFLRSYFGLGHTLKSAVEQASGAMIGMIPAGLMLLTSVALAVGAITLARRKTLVQELFCIETLSRVDMLCLDKTGTLTAGCMEVTGVEPIDDAYTAEQLEQLLCDFVQAMENDNPTANALHARFTAQAVHKPVKTIPFSSARKYSGAVFEKTGTLYLGAPEFLCADMDEKLKARIDSHAKDGYRVLLFACKNGEVFEQGCEPDALEPIAFVICSDKLREEAEDTLRFFLEQDVDIKLISGDHPATVASIAKRLHLPDSDSWIDMSTLQTDEEVMQAATKYRIFGRVLPKQKKLLVQALKQAGHTVAMTGDGVNDVLALKEADCSIAMASGSDAASQVSQLVLLDSNFASMPAVVMEGRRVINNITRTASLFLVKTMFSFLLVVLSLLFAFPYPFQPVQLSLISTLTVGTPAFFLALEPNKARISEHFLFNVLKKAGPGALCIVLYIMMITIFTPLLGLTQMQTNTLYVYTTGMAALTILLRVCMPMSRSRFVLFAAMTIAFFGAAVCLRNILHIGLLTVDMLWLFVPLTLACYPLLHGSTALIEHIFKVVKERRESREQK